MPNQLKVLPILCLDFDGVIHSYTTPWINAATIPDPPVEGAIEFLLQALEHFTVVIYSSRSGQRGGIDAMVAWLKQHASDCWDNDDHDGLCNIEFASEKPAAFLTIDDRAICFDGTWPSIESLKSFKPWNKK